MMILKNFLLKVLENKFTALVVRPFSIEVSGSSGVSLELFSILGIKCPSITHHT